MPIPTYRQMLAMAERRLSKRIGATEKEITRIYAQARRDIRDELSKAYERYAVNGELTRAEMTKYNRLTNLEKSLTTRLNGADNEAINITHRLTREQYQEAFFNRAWAIDNELTAQLTWGRLNADAVRESVENPLHRIADRRLRANGRERIRATIASGLTRGDSFAQMSREIRDVINGSRHDAVRIARTEGQRAQAMGSQRAHERAEELGVEGNEYWAATLDGRTRDRHGQLDGKPKDKERGGWRVPGTNTYTPGPLQSGIPSFDINCFPGFVSAEGHEIKGATKRAYSGKVIRIESSGGLSITTTPNHPILTNKGWIAANLVNETCDIFTMKFGKLADVIDPYVEHSPSVFSQIHDFLSVGAPVHRVPGVNEQFHGDGGESNVDIVALDSKLGCSIDPSCFNHIEQLNLPLADILPILLSGDSRFYERFNAFFASPDSRVSSFGDSLPLFRRAIGHSDIHGFASIPGSDSVFSVNPADDTARNAESCGSSLAGFSSMVSSDKVVSVDSFNFSGHVYNLHTKSNWFIVSDNPEQSNGNGAIVHNCRCAVEYRINDEAPEVRRIRGKGVVEYRTYEEWKPPTS